VLRPVAAAIWQLLRWPVADIDVVPTILDVVCQTAGMGFAAVARVTEDRWIVCQALDKIEFGLVTGSELPVQTTICDEIRESGHAVVIDHVAEDNVYRHHHTPAMYGFESYISMPIVLKDRTFWCACPSCWQRPADGQGSRLRRPLAPCRDGHLGQ
jgi:GAF domain-containing protein